MQMGGKSGQHRAPCFLTGRYKIGDDFITASAAENNSADTVATSVEYNATDNVRSIGARSPKLA